MYSKPQKLVAEFIGTFALIFFGAGSICADQFLRTSSNGQSAWDCWGSPWRTDWPSALWSARSATYQAATSIRRLPSDFGSLAKFSTFDTLAYWIAQVAGGVAAYLLRRFPSMSGDLFNWARPIWPAALRTNGMIFEGIMTFFLVFVVFATAVDDTRRIQQDCGLCHRSDNYDGRAFRRALYRRGTESGACIRACRWHRITGLITAFIGSVR